MLIGTLAEVEANEHCAFCRLLNHEIHSADHAWKDVASYKDTSHIKVCIQATRADNSSDMRYIDEGTQDKVATKLTIFLDALRGLSGADESNIVRPSRDHGIQLLPPDSINPARPLMNGYEHAGHGNSLKLLCQWMDTCVEKHKDESEAGSCRRPHFCAPDARPDYGIRVIDVQNRTVVEKGPGEIDYAALSYVWDAALQKSDAPEDQVEASQGFSSVLPPQTHKVIEDATFVCKELGIPYLWVDCYCIDQSDLLSKGTEIEGMAFRYLYAKITLIAGISAKADSEVGLFQDDEQITQRFETIRGRKYITAMPTIIDDIYSSQWHRRTWTTQEGQLANRCAFFGTWGIAFLCGQGHWTSSLRNVPYGHDATMNGIKADCEGDYVLPWMNWMRDKTWPFSGAYLISLDVASASEKETWALRNIQMLFGKQLE